MQTHKWKKEELEQKLDFKFQFCNLLLTLDVFSGSLVFFIHKLYQLSSKTIINIENYLCTILSIVSRHIANLGMDNYQRISLIPVGQQMFLVLVFFV